MKKTITIIIAIAAIGFYFMLSGCKVNQDIADKSGAQLWAENCRRCHNAPDQYTHNPESWITVGLHMQSRALLTNRERDKIINFLSEN
jgi:cytochrome c2